MKITYRLQTLKILKPFLKCPCGSSVTQSDLFRLFVCLVCVVFMCICLLACVCVCVCKNQCCCWPVSFLLWFSVGESITNSDHSLTDLSLCVRVCVHVRRWTVHIISIAHIDSLGWLRRTVAN